MHYNTTTRAVLSPHMQEEEEVFEIVESAPTTPILYPPSLPSIDLLPSSLQQQSTPSRQQQMKKKKPHVVISHHVNTMGRSATMVAKALKGVGLSVYVQNDEFEEMFSLTADGEEVTHISAEEEMIKNIKEADMVIFLMNQEWADSAQCADEYHLAKRLHQSSFESGRSSKKEQRKPKMIPVVFKELDWEGQPHVEVLVSSPSILMHDGRNLTEGATSTIDAIVAVARRMAQDMIVASILSAPSSSVKSSPQLSSSTKDTTEPVVVHLDLTGDFPKPNFKKDMNEETSSSSSPSEDAEILFRLAQVEFMKSNMKAAEELYIKAANLNHATAQGYCYFYGFGQEKSEDKAVLAWLEGARVGHSSSILRMGLCFYNGEGVKQNRKIAAQMFAMASSSDPSQSAQLGDCSANGAGGEEGDEEKTCDLASSQEDASAQNNLGVCYTNGTAVEKDTKKAAELFEQAAAKGYAVAQNNLGSCLYKGKGVKKDKKKAVKLFAQAAAQGNASAQYNLAYCYRNGSGIGKDKKKAAELFGLAADQGLSEAQYNLGLLYKADGNRLKAKEYMTKAAKQGHGEAVRALGKL